MMFTNKYKKKNLLVKIMAIYREKNQLIFMYVFINFLLVKLIYIF